MTIGCYPFYHVGPAPQRFIVCVCISAVGSRQGVQRLAQPPRNFFVGMFSEEDMDAFSEVL